mmetsp:Transcript_23590/g.62149  ORF Transcript_23590/g.62149 Transcript_23590/m.62149 type:complete len:279 (-) Transcript_23590:1188-2024(-)
MRRSMNSSLSRGCDPRTHGLQRRESSGSRQRLPFLHWERHSPRCRSTGRHSRSRRSTRSHHHGSVGRRTFPEGRRHRKSHASRRRWRRQTLLQTLLQTPPRRRPSARVAAPLPQFPPRKACVQPSQHWRRNHRFELSPRHARRPFRMLPRETGENQCRLAAGYQAKEAPSHQRWLHRSSNNRVLEAVFLLLLGNMREAPWARLQPVEVRAAVSPPLKEVHQILGMRTHRVPLGAHAVQQPLTMPRPGMRKTAVTSGVRRSRRSTDDGILPNLGRYQPC